MRTYLAIDAGGTFLKSAVLNSKGEVFQNSAVSEKSFSEGSKEEILCAFRGIISKGLQFIAEDGASLGGLGIAFPGPFDIKKAIPLMEHKFQAIYGINLRDYFYKISGIPSNVPIKFIHDSNAVIAGEIWKGNARGFDNAAVITLGTGLGFAISMKGKVLCNELGGPYLSIFNLPWRGGILENYTAKQGFLKIYSELSGKTDVDDIQVSDLGEWANKGDAASIKTFKMVGEILAKSLQNILREKNIQCLLFSGQISRSFCHMEASLKEGFKNVEYLKKISVVKSIDDAALLGTLRNIIKDELCESRVGNNVKSSLRG